MATESYLPYHIGYLTDWMVKKAENELNETNETSDAIFKEFKQLVEKETFSSYWKKDDYLLQFLRAKKFNVNRALKCLKSFYKTRNERKDIFPKKLDVENLKEFFDCEYGSNLSLRDEDGCVIIMIKLGNWDPDVYSMGIVLSAVTALALHALQEPATQVCGVRILLDMKDTNLNHVKHVRPRDLKLVGNALRSLFPIRIKTINVMNQSTVTQVLFNLLKVFLSEKVKRRFHFHGDNVEELYKFIPRKILPPEYGGDNVHHNSIEWCRREMESFYPTYSDLHL